MCHVLLLEGPVLRSTHEVIYPNYFEVCYIKPAIQRQMGNFFRCHVSSHQAFDWQSFPSLASQSVFWSCAASPTKTEDVNGPRARTFFSTKAEAFRRSLFLWTLLFFWSRKSIPWENLQGFLSLLCLHNISIFHLLWRKTWGK